MNNVGISEQTLANNSLVQALRQKKPSVQKSLTSLMEGADPLKVDPREGANSPHSVEQVPFSRPESPRQFESLSKSPTCFTSVEPSPKESVSSSSKGLSEKKSTTSDQPFTRPRSHSLDNADIPNVSKLYEVVPANNKPSQRKPLTPIEQQRAAREQARVAEIARQMIHEAKTKYYASQTGEGNHGE